jgi:catechol 2,3-dioxygenase-like lactoylglutathione lyase family enzyme
MAQSARNNDKNVFPFLRLDHVQVAIPQGGEELARAFYVDAFGLEEIAKPEELAARGGLWLRSGDVCVHLGVDRDFHPATKAHPAFQCADYDTLLERLRGRGIEVLDDDNAPDGSRHCYVNDPFGNRLELIEDKRD